MRLGGRRIHIAGSADPATPHEKLRYAHTIVAELVAELARQGATFVAQIGREPRAAGGESSPSVIFDWTIIETVGAQLNAGSAAAHSAAGRLVTVISTHKTEQQIPEERRELWSRLTGADAVLTQHIEGYWTSGAVRRERQAQVGDVLIAVSGGEGVEHLAQLYAGEGKPVIPLALDLGSSTSAGSGGASRLNQDALAHPEQFFRLKDPSGGVTGLARAATRNGDVAVADVVGALLKLLGDLRDPEAFYVRLLNSAVAEFADVESFFRAVVDPVIADLGYSAAEMGTTSVEEAFANVEIFTRIHHADIVVIDLTAMRPNCMMEFGYALGRVKRAVVTARDGTSLPFDPSAIDIYAWDPEADAGSRIRDLKTYCARTALRPPLVRPRGWQQ